MSKREAIIVRGAREHNLKDIDVTLPREQLVVITGPSGSGKSSLAFDTIYAEANRRFIEGLSPHARLFLEQLAKPDVDSIEGLSPAIAVEQKTTATNKRATVGTITEILDYLRVLFARLGTPWCPQCDTPIARNSAEDIVRAIEALPVNSKVQLLAPLVEEKKGSHAPLLADLQKQGFVRVWIDGAVYPLEDEVTLLKDAKHSIAVVLDRLVIKGGIRARLTDSVEQCLKLAHGSIRLLIESPGEAERTEDFSEHFACDVCGFTIPQLEPSLFSFNTHRGACHRCHGLGSVKQVLPELLIPDSKLSISKDAVVAWRAHRKLDLKYRKQIKKLLEKEGIAVDTAWEDLPEKMQSRILHGDTPLADRGRKKPQRGIFEGVIPNLERRFHETESDRARAIIEKFMEERICPDCAGARFSEAARAVRVLGETIQTLSEKNLQLLFEFFKESNFSELAKEVFAPLQREIVLRLEFLLSLGLSYLTCARSAASLSGGEAQRIRLAGQLGSQLSGVLYVLDEPSVGLHPRDNNKLVQMLQALRDLGNTVIVVEHDREMIEAADFVLDMGPGAGVLGGSVIANGSPAQLSKNKVSKTGEYLRGDFAVFAPAVRRKRTKQSLVLHGATAHNLKDITVEIPLGLFVCVTGVSGSGKSSLINDTLYPAIARELNGASVFPGAYRKLTGLEHIDKIIAVDQSPIGQTPRSNPATYVGLFDLVRERFSLLPEAQARGFGPGRFSFNTKGGRCETCHGAGVVRVAMHFLPDVFVQCETCLGKRYNQETLAIRYRGLTIADVLEFTVDDAANFFATIPAAKAKLETLQAVGLGYLKLGQPAPSLSGGESQRVKLAAELSKRQTGQTLYLLDEPTTGLHAVDVDALSRVLHALVDQGNTVLVIEHNIDLIRSADWIIDMGPEGGDSGGNVVISGAPEEIKKTSASLTGRYL